MVGKVILTKDTMLGIKHAEIQGTVIRADGTVEELGIIASTDHNTPSKKPNPLYRGLRIVKAKIGALL